MNTEKEITCIICPIGCKILLSINEDRFNIVKGTKCKKGVEYAKAEVCDPRRMLTTSVLVQHGEWPLVSVKSSHPLPKEHVFAVLQMIKQIIVNAPVMRGQVLMSNVKNTGIDIVATKTVHTKQKKQVVKNIPPRNQGDAT